MRRLLVMASFMGIAIAPAHAQTSASFKLNEFTLNAGGDPQNGSSAASASFHIKLDAIGDAAAGAGLSSASFRGDAGFVGGYPPPGEVQSFRFIDKTIFGWNPERSVGEYEIYRGTIASVSGSNGTCFAQGGAAEAAVDVATPSAGQGWFYLVTARNRLKEEGTMGFRSSGAERANTAPCP